MTAPIEVRDLSKSFQKPVLQGVNLSVKPGEIVSLLGRSGTGKSVLLKLLIGIEQPDAGTVLLHGKEIAGLPRHELNELRKKIGFLFQQAALYDSMSIVENVAFPLRRHSDMPEEESTQKAVDLLAKLGLDGGHEKMPGEISGGMKKRVGLARALALDPDILMLDEPTAGLDPITATEILDLVQQIRKERNAACLIVTHDLHNARKITDRFLVLNEGKVVIDGTYDDLSASEEPFIQEYLKDAV